MESKENKTCERYIGYWATPKTKFNILPLVPLSRLLCNYEFFFFFFQKYAIYKNLDSLNSTLKTLTRDHEILKIANKFKYIRNYNTVVTSDHQCEL